MDVKTKKAEQGEATRRSLLDAARALFTEHGFTDTPTEELVRRAGVTRGALYHHFTDKRELFRAVVEELQTEMAGKVAAAVRTRENVWECAMEAMGAFLDACLEPSVRRIVLNDAPSVLGWETWREMDARHGLDLVKVPLQTAMDEGLLEPVPIEPLARMILGALNEGALAMARAEDPRHARDEVEAALTRLLEGLRKPERRTGGRPAS